VPNRHGYYYKQLCEKTAGGSVAPSGICLYHFPTRWRVSVHRTSLCHLRTEGTKKRSAQNALSSCPTLLVYQPQRSGKSSILSHLFLSPYVQQWGPHSWRPRAVGVSWTTEPKSKAYSCPSLTKSPNGGTFQQPHMPPLSVWPQPSHTTATSKTHIHSYLLIAVAWKRLRCKST